MAWKIQDPSELLREEQNKKNALSQPIRFFLKPETEKRIIILDDFNETEKDQRGNLVPIVPFPVREHQVVYRGDYRHWLTCTSMFYDDAPCPLCIRNYMVDTHYVMTALVEARDKDGNEIWWKNLFSSKSKTYDAINTVLKEAEMANGNLKNWLLLIKRTAKTSPQTGDQVILKKQYTKEQIERLNIGGENPDISPFNYKELLMPMEPKIIESMLGGEIQKPLSWADRQKAKSPSCNENRNNYSGNSFGNNSDPFLDDPPF